MIPAVNPGQPKLVIFVCYGNVCRSPMAAGFANFYGQDVLLAVSRGLMPVPGVPQDTIRVMKEKGVDISGHVSKRYDMIEGGRADLVVNMSGYRLPGPPPRMMVEWEIKDPYTKRIEEFRKTRDQLEQMVMRLILEFRRKQSFR